MILLTHGCSCSELKVNPKNWKTGGKILLKKNWRIHYYFRDQEFKEQYPYGKLISVKGMNKFKTLEERREATKILIEEEYYALKVQGYNPITKTTNGPDIDFDPEISPDTTICEAVELARKKITAEKSTLTDLKTSAKYFNKSCRQLRYHLIRVADIKRRHIYNILENQQKQNKYTNERYNKIRAYMHMIFKQLVKSDAIEYNLISEIDKLKETKKIPITFTDDEINSIITYLKPNHYPFYRYFQIFFHSGSRSTEMFDLKRSDIDLDNQRFKILVKKGKYNEEQWRGINKNVFKYWVELYNAADLNDYIFSYNFSPGPTKIAARQVSDKWRKYIKNRLGINKSFYKLKSLHTTKVITLYNRDLAAGINGHKSTKMNDKHYDALHRERIIEQAKNMNISL